MYYLVSNIKNKNEEKRITDYIKMQLKTTLNIESAEGIVILGGDGTVLKTLLHCQVDEPPTLYTINYGSVGAMLMFSPDELNAVIYQLQSQNDLKTNFSYFIRKRLYLSDFGYFMNEVTITSKAQGKLNKFTIFVNDEYMTDVQGDAIIVSTSTGSSAYNLSAGGSFVDNYCDCIILKIVSPFRSRFTGMIFPIFKKIKINIEKNGKCIIDGIAEYEQNTIEICYKENNVKFAYFKTSESIEKRMFDKNFR